MSQHPSFLPTNPAEQSVIMTRDDLENIPAFDWPAGFSIRSFQPGDDRVWWDIHERADPFKAHLMGTHRQFFGDDLDELRARQWFIMSPDGEPIGTASAWRDSDEVGRVHWVAIVPEFQGRGLAKPLLTHVLTTLRDLGHARAILDTSQQRPRAIALYRFFGFEIN